MEEQHINAGPGLYSSSLNIYAEANSRGDTPLHCLARAGNETALRALLETGAADSSLRAQNAGGNTALHEAASGDHVGAAVALLRREPELAAVVNGWGESPLFVAVQRGVSVELVRVLLNCRHCHCGGPDGQTALHRAVFRQYRIAELIVAKKPELISLVDDFGSTPLHYAACSANTKMVRLLLEHNASPNQVDKGGLSPIHVAAAMGYVDVIREILQWCGDAAGKLIDNKGKNFLHVASKKKMVEVVHYVLTMPSLGGLINEQDENGDTPLHVAVAEDSKEIVRLLLTHKRIDTKVRNNKGQTPFHLASSCDDPSMHLWMLKIMSDLNHCRVISNKLAVVAIVIMSVTFAAAFTLPRGYDSCTGPHQPMATILTKQMAFKTFLLSDVLAMISAIAVTCLLIYSEWRDHDVRVAVIAVGARVMRVAFLGMAVAFATGAYAAVASDCWWLASVICLVAGSIVLFLIWVLIISPDARWSAATTEKQKLELMM